MCICTYLGAFKGFNLTISSQGEFVCILCEDFYIYFDSTNDYHMYNHHS